MPNTLDRTTGSWWRVRLRVAIGVLLVSTSLVTGCSAGKGELPALTVAESAAQLETTRTVSGTPAWAERVTFSLSVPAGTLVAGLRYPAVISQTDGGTSAVMVNGWDLVALDSNGREVFDWFDARDASMQRHVPSGHDIRLQPGETNRQVCWFQLPRKGVYTLTIAGHNTSVIPLPASTFPTITVEAR